MSDKAARSALRTMAIALLLGAIFSESLRPAFAQAPNPAPAQETSAFGPRRQIATIIMAGLGGAVLGLSTLSFYGRPQDYLSNIAVGFAIGVITGTVISTYQAATRPRFGSLMLDELLKMQPSSSTSAQATQLNYTWNF